MPALKLMPVTARASREAQHILHRHARLRRLTNNTSKAIQLKGWTVHDKSNHVYTFASSYSLGGQACLHPHRTRHRRQAGLAAPLPELRQLHLEQRRRHHETQELLGQDRRHLLLEVRQRHPLLIDWSV
jgi:hypothetical protein